MATRHPVQLIDSTPPLTPIIRHLYWAIYNHYSSLYKAFEILAYICQAFIYHSF